jgi:hypothetical protein
MSVKPVLAVLVLSAGLAACVPTTPAPPPARPDLNTCTSNAAHDLVGTPVSLVNTSQLAATVRILPPNGVATMDYNPARLNIETDANGTITRVSCG